MKVAINGSGVAGPTLAYWLRRWGHEPVLFEQAPSLRTGGYIIDFWGLGYELAERMGIVPALRERCYLMQRLSMVDATGREVASMDIAPMREQLQGRFLSVARADLASALFQACHGVPANFGVSVAALEPGGDDGVVAVLSNGERQRFDLVVGADGLHSRVREITFGPEAAFEQHLGCHVAAFRLPEYPHRDELTYVSHTVPKRHVARVTLLGGETLILLVCRSELVGDPPRAERKAVLRRAFGEMKWEVPDILDGLDGVEDVYFDRVSQIHLERWTSGRTALLGDAAACASFLAGEGTGLAMIEAYVLAGEIHRSGRDLARGLAAYDARLRSFVSKKQKTALGLRGFFVPQTALGVTLRNMAVNAFSIPFVAKHLVLRSLRDEFELPDYEAA